MKEYIKPDVSMIEFEVEAITVSGDGTGVTPGGGNDI